MSSQRKRKKIAKFAIYVTSYVTSKFDVSQFLTFTSLDVNV